MTKFRQNSNTAKIIRRFKAGLSPSVGVTTTASVPTESQMKKYVSKVLRTRGLKPELKYRFALASASAMSASGAADCLCTMDQGTDDIQRVGDRILIKFVEITGFIQSTGAANFDQVQLAVYVDKQINGSASNFLVATSSTTASPFQYYNVASPLGAAIVVNEDFKKRYTIKEWKQMHGNQQVGSTAWQVCSFKIRVNFATPLLVEYNTSGGTVAAVQTNGLMFGYSNLNGNTSSISYLAKIGFVDP